MHIEPDDISVKGRRPTHTLEVPNPEWMAEISGFLIMSGLAWTAEPRPNGTWSVGLLQHSVDALMTAYPQVFTVENT